jgi:hypothetical protein
LSAYYPLYANCLGQFNQMYPQWGCGGAYYPGYYNNCYPSLNVCNVPWNNCFAASYTPSTLNIRRRRKCDN